VTVTDEFHVHIKNILKLPKINQTENITSLSVNV